MTVCELILTTAEIVSTKVMITAHEMVCEVRGKRALICEATAGSPHVGRSRRAVAWKTWVE
jgi:hypothetical protein